MTRPGLTALACLIQTYAITAWPRSLNVTHHFHTTDEGQLHYVLGGNLETGVPLVLLHSDPRSSVEFKHLLAAVSKPQPFVAVDFYGMGFSEECRCGGSAKFVKFTDYAHSVYDILLKHGIDEFVPVGCLKGSYPALALADLAGATKVKHIVQISPLMLPPAAIDYMNKKFIPSILHPVIKQTGAHLLDVWNDASAAPFGPDGKLDDSPQDLMVNEEKTIDFLRCRNNGARPKNQMAWVDYNDKIPAAVSRVSRHARFLILYGTRITADFVKYGMHPEWSMAQLASALDGGVGYVNITVQDADQGLLSQNSTLIAGYLEHFLKSRPTEVV